jgi:hypothetical protein
MRQLLFSLAHAVWLPSLTMLLLLLLLLQDMLVLTHQLAKISTRLDQPLAALELFAEAAARHPGDIGLLLGQARLQEGLGNRQAALQLYHQVCSLACPELVYHRGQSEVFADGLYHAASQLYHQVVA